MDRGEKGKYIQKTHAQVMKSRGGRPRIYDDPQKLLDDAYEYLDWCEETQKGHYTLMGLRGYLRLYTRQDWHRYKNDPRFSDAILELENILNQQAEHRIRYVGSFAGGQYFLKCHGGDEWQDVQRHETKLDVNQIKVSFGGTTLHTPSQSETNT